MTPTQHLLRQGRPYDSVISESESDGTGREVYYGEAYRGTATNVDGWIIQKTTYGANSTSTRVSRFGVKWTERETVTYS